MAASRPLSCRLSTFLLSVVFATIASHVAAEPTCANDRFLNDCGYVGIQQAQCEGQDCCWNPNVPEGQPWCFRKNGGYTYFSPSLPRVDCGYFGIFRFQCETRGCMYSPAFGVPWCFYPNTNIDPETCPFRRVECGYYGIQQDECESRGCCWSPLEEGSAEPWCFHSTESEPAPAVEAPPEEPTEETPPSISVPPELTRVMYPEEEEGEGLAIRTRPEPSAEETTETAWEAEASAVAPATTAKRTTVQNEKLQDETSQALELNFDADWIDQQNSKPSRFRSYVDFFSVSCGSEILTENECLAIADCYWVAEATPGFGTCWKRQTDPGRRSMGKFFKPKTIY